MSLDHLERELDRHADRSTLIGSFSAASNVTGIITDTVAVSTLLECGFGPCPDHPTGYELLAK